MVRIKPNRVVREGDKKAGNSLKAGQNQETCSPEARSQESVLKKKRERETGSDSTDVKQN